MNFNCKFLLVVILSVIIVSPLTVHAETASKATSRVGIMFKENQTHSEETMPSEQNHSGNFNDGNTINQGTSLPMTNERKSTLLVFLGLFLLIIVVVYVNKKNLLSLFCKRK